MLSKNSLKWGAIIVAILFIVLYFLFFRKSKRNIHDSSNVPTFIVIRGPLTISVIESGTIKASEQIIIKNEVEGKTSILWLIEEGKNVAKGDLLIELDASNLINEEIDQEIGVQNTEAAYIGARENLAVIKNQSQSDIDKAKLDFSFSKQDLEKYLKGEYPNERKEAESRITLAQEDLTRSRDKLEWSEKLYNEKYISESELRADELALKKTELELELEKNNLNLLENFTYTKRIAELKSDVKQTEMTLEREVRKAKADEVQAVAEFKAKESEFNRQKDKLLKIKEQIIKTKIYAPADGLVIYATSAKSSGRHGSTEPLAEGQEMRERQELIYLPTASAVKAEVSIHEASLKKVKLNLPAKVTVDALPDRSFLGKVIKIAPLPDAQSTWMNPDLKVYPTEIYLDSNSAFLRSGMSCKAEIIIAQYEDAVYIPVQAVIRIGDQSTAYIVEGASSKPRKIEIGLDNNRMVRIISGLEPGEVVSLKPPLDASTVNVSKVLMTPNRDE